MTHTPRERDLAPGSFLEDPEEMRRSGYAVVDAIIDRWTRLGDGPALRGATRDVTGPLLHGPPSEEGRDLDELLQTILGDVLPLAARVDHPRFLAFIPSSPTWASVLASFLTTGYNVFQGTWLEAGGPSQIELTVTDWFREWMGYPESGGGLFTSGGSAANLMAIVAAREAAGNPDRGTVYMSAESHGSVRRAARIAGIDPALLRVVPTDDSFRVLPSRLLAAVKRDRANGLEPFYMVATAGTTNTGSIDPLVELANVARSEGLWYHVDAAYGGFAVLDPATRPLLQGIELSDSVTLDPHKWLFQPYETGCLIVRDVSRLAAAFRITPDYLQDAELGPTHVNFCDRGLQLTRIFRALRVWLSLQKYGLDAHRAEIARAIELARRVEARVRDDDELELRSPQSLGVVCFRYRGDGSVPLESLDELNKLVQDDIVRSGFAMISSTRIKECFSLRFCVLNYRTTEDDLHRTLDRIVETGRRLSTATANHGGAAPGERGRQVQESGPA